MAFKINQDISKASTIPKEFYLDHHYFNLCLNTIFPNSWQFIINKEKLQNSNIYPLTYLKDSLEEPIVLIKHKNVIKCFSNVCTHRAHLVIDKPCKKNKLRCKYHGRTFNLDGNFNTAPGFDDAKNFPTEKDNLKPIFIKIWKNFILLSLKGMNRLNDSSIIYEDEIEYGQYISRKTMDIPISLKI